MTKTYSSHGSLIALLTSHFRIDPGRVQRAREIQTKGWVTLTHHAPLLISAKVSGNYDVRIDLRTGHDLICNCPDWSSKGQQAYRPCKHLLAVALAVDAVQGVSPQPVVAPTPEAEPDTVTVPIADDGLPDFEEASFTDQVRSAIGRAIAALADMVEVTVRAGEIPFLVGPTGVGKTSAVRQVATRNGWGFEEVTGSESWADADLLGLRTDHMEQPGVFARAFTRARDGETVLLFIDEALRFNSRAHDLFMRPFQPTPVDVARAMGLPVHEPVRLVEAPLWGIEWAPVSKVHIVLSANPWGSVLDPALVRRVWPLPVDLDEAVVKLFDPALADAIRASWNAVRQGELPLPIEYQALARARHPGDTSLLRAYLVRLSVVDKAASEGFKTLVEGMGIAL
jgi:hypothetical protein